MSEANPSDWSTAPADELEQPSPPGSGSRYDLWAHLEERRQREELGDLADPNGHWFHVREVEL